MSLVRLVFLALVLAGCKPDRDGRAFRCACEGLTDTDGTVDLSLMVCATSDEDAPERALGCAQQRLPMNVTGCRCDAVSAPAGSAPAGSASAVSESATCRVGCLDR